MLKMEPIREQKDISGTDVPHISVVLDKSGSMTIDWKKTIASLSDFLFKQREAFPAATYDITVFSDNVDCYVNNRNISSFKGLSPDDIFPDGLTALYKAIITTCRKLRFAKPNSRKFCVIVTDGQDNKSPEGSQKTAYKLVDEQKKNGVEFFFLGAGIDSFAEAKKIGIPYAANISLGDDDPGSLDCNIRQLSNGICHLVRTRSTTNECPELLRAYTEPQRKVRPKQKGNVPMDLNVPVLQRCAAGDCDGLPPQMPIKLTRQRAFVNHFTGNTNSD